MLIGVISGDWGRREMIMLEILQVTSDKLCVGNVLQKRKRFYLKDNKIGKIGTVV